MKQLFFCITILISFVMQGEDIFVHKTKIKKEMSVQKMKEELAHNYESLLHQATKSIKHLSSFIDEIVSNIKQLAGEEQGALTVNEKQVIKQHQQKIEELEALLDQLQSMHINV